jgi:hypothetical protein
MIEILRQDRPRGHRPNPGSPSGACLAALLDAVGPSGRYFFGFEFGLDADGSSGMLLGHQIT